VAFAGVVAVTYSVLRVGLLSWYVLPVEVVLVYGVAFATGNLARLAARTSARSGPERWAAVAVALAMALAVGLPLARASYGWAASFGGFGRLNAYRDAGEWIAATTSPSAKVAAPEIGVVGYYSRRPLGDLFGLVSPESLPHVARRDLVGALRAQHAELVVARSSGRMHRVVRSPWFRRTYREAIRFPVPSGRGWVAVYRRRPAAPRAQGLRLKSLGDRRR
jgi:hypothetical protein